MMDAAQEVKEMSVPASIGMKQFELMMKADREYKKMIEDGILVKSERQVASSMEMSSMYFSYPQKN